MSTIFGRIIKRELPAKIIFENEHVLVIEDIHPQAPVHLLIIPKKEIHDIQSMKADELFLLGEVVQVAQKLAKQYQITDGYRLLTNNGGHAGQTIFHLHFHLIGGKELGPMA